MKIRILELFVHMLAVVLTLSLIEFFIYVITDKIIIIQDGILSYDYDYQMSLFNLMRVEPGLGMLSTSNFFRFQSLAEEPGGVGTMCGILIYCLNNSGKFKYDSAVIWIAGIVSMSRAFYVLALIRLAITIFYKNKWSGFMFVAVLAVTIFALYSQFEDAFNVLLLGRFEDLGLERVDDASLIQAFANGTIWFGNGTEATLKLHSAGVGTMIYQVGIIRTFLLAAFYLFAFVQLVKSVKLNYKLPAFLFCLAFFASFYQRQYILNFNFVLVYFTMPFFAKYYETAKTVMLKR